MYTTRFVVLVGDTVRLVSPTLEVPFPPFCVGMDIQLTDQVVGFCEDGCWNVTDNSFDLLVRVQSDAPNREQEYHLEVLTELLKEAGYEDAPDEDE